MSALDELAERLSEAQRNGLIRATVAAHCLALVEQAKAELTEESGIRCGSTGAVYSDKPYGYRHPSEECQCQTTRVRRYMTEWEEA